MSDEASAAERPATFREVFTQAEFRAVFFAVVLSWIGDYMAKAAVTVLVFNRTNSVALSAAAFAVSFLPWVLGGPLLAALAERYPYRRVMVTCDLARMALIAVIAVPGLPTGALLALLFVAMLANPPAQAARSALMPLILPRDRLVVGLAVQHTAGQAAQVGGYLAGAAVAVFDPRLALLIDAATFALSALVIRLGVRDRPPALAAARRSTLLRETADGFRLVFGQPVLRAIAVIVYAVMLFAIVPEGLAAAWAAETTSAPSDAGARGVDQALIMASGPVGFILGGLLISRLVRPDRRRRLIRPFAVLAPLALVPALLDPPAIFIALMAAVSGFAVAGMIPAANGVFVMALPHGFRARAYGVMQAGMQIAQGGAVLATGLLADRWSIPRVVGFWSLAGVALMLFIAYRWPSHHQLSNAIAEVTPVVVGRASVSDMATLDLAESAGRVQAIDDGPTQRLRPAPSDARGPGTGVGTPA